MQRRTLVALVTLLGVTATPLLAQNSAGVEPGVRMLADALRRTWDARDIDAYMQNFGEPEGLIVSGGTAHTLQSLRETTQRIWSDRTSDVWKNDRVDVIPLGSDAALMQITFSGRYTLRSGVTWNCPSSAVTTALVRRIAGQWKIVASQNAGSCTQTPAP